MIGVKIASMRIAAIGIASMRTVDVGIMLIRSVFRVCFMEKSIWD